MPECLDHGVLYSVAFRVSISFVTLNGVLCKSPAYLPSPRAGVVHPYRPAIEGRHRYNLLSTFRKSPVNSMWIYRHSAYGLPWNHCNFTRNLLSTFRKSPVNSMWIYRHSAYGLPWNRYNFTYNLLSTFRKSTVNRKWIYCRSAYGFPWNRYNFTRNPLSTFHKSPVVLL